MMRLSDFHPALPGFPLTTVVALWCVLLSVLLFTFYGYDKRQAERGGRRVPESRLQGMALCGGWLGGVAGQQFFRHKTRKPGFQVVFWLIGVMQLLLLTASLWPEPYRLILRQYVAQWF
ncbi:MAG: DUF1294 domain-containing protein [Marinobacterium sp.]|nr:DUF1294 domain-containing protein [Marinobacterium sp.]